MLSKLPTEITREILSYMTIWEMTLLCRLSLDIPYTRFYTMIRSLCGLDHRDQVWMHCPHQKTFLFQPSALMRVVGFHAHIHCFVVDVECMCGRTHNLSFSSIEMFRRKTVAPHTVPYYTPNGDLFMGCYDPIAIDEICVGDKMDVMDMDNVWYRARVIQKKDKVIRVHYTGWSSSFDEDIPIGSPRLAKEGQYVSPWSIQPYKNVDFQLPTKRWYNGLVVSIENQKVSIYCAKTNNTILIHYNEENIAPPQMHTASPNKSLYRKTHSLLSTKWKGSKRPVFLSYFPTVRSQID